MGKTHKEMYPEQYRHSLCGQKSKVVIRGEVKKTGTVERVVNSRFGALAVFEGDNEQAWAVGDVVPI